MPELLDQETLNWALHTLITLFAQLHGAAERAHSVLTASFITVGPMVAAVLKETHSVSGDDRANALILLVPQRLATTSSGFSQDALDREERLLELD